MAQVSPQERIASLLRRGKERGLAVSWPLLGVGRTAVALLLLLGSVAVLLLPVLAPVYFSVLMVTFFAYAVVVLGFNLLFGYTGLLSFGHALFLAVGAYTAAFATQFGIRQMEAIILLAALAAALVAAPVGMLCVRYVQIYFAMLTLAFGMLFYSFVLKFYNITGGDQGMRMLQPYLLGLELVPEDRISFLVGPYYYYSVVLLALLAWLMWRIVHSPFGLCLRAIRENPTKAEYLGISVRRFRWYAFMISAVYGGTGGAMLATVTGHVDPGMAYWTQSGNLVFMTILGGFANFFGPLLGSFAFILLQDRVMAVTDYWRLALGAMLVLIVIFVPGGLMSLLRRWRIGGEG